MNGLRQSGQGLKADMPHVPAFRFLPTSDLCLVLIISAILTLVFTTSEHFQENNGLGHDGLSYALLARSFPHYVFVDGTDAYTVQRLAIPAVLYYSSKTFGFELTDKTILRMWRGLDLVCLTLLAYLWCLTARELRIGQRGKWLGAVLLFVNFAVLKWSSFYSNLSDIPAYALGGWMLYCHVRGRSLVLAVVTVIGAFTWPTALCIGILLLLFPREKVAKSGACSVSMPLPAMAVMFAGLCIYLLLQYQRHRGGYYIGDETRADGAFLNLGILCSAIYVVGGLFYLLEDRRFFSIGYYASRLTTFRGWLALAMGVAIIVSQWILAPKSASVPPEVILNSMLWSSVVDPGVFVVAHVAFYGPVILLAVLHWSRVCKLAHECSMGITLSLCVLIPLALGSESRRLFNLIPLLVPFVVKAIEEFNWQFKHYFFVLVVSTFGSKVWLTINPDWKENLLRLNMAPWMSHTSYAVHSCIILAIGYILFNSLKTARQNGPRIDPDQWDELNTQEIAVRRDKSQHIPHIPTGSSEHERQGFEVRGRN
jgi:hypothetical protein